MTVPLESYEQEQLTKYLDRNNYIFSAIRNESDFNNIQKGAKRKREGVRKGIPDFCIILKRQALLLIELKRQIDYSRSMKGKKMSVVSSEQLKWQEELNLIPGVQCNVCRGYEEAVILIKRIEDVPTRNKE